jgi:hypothetical protein
LQFNHDLKRKKKNINSQLEEQEVVQVASKAHNSLYEAVLAQVPAYTDDNPSIRTCWASVQDVQDMESTWTRNI